MSKVLFILKKNESYGGRTFSKRSGLFNSTNFVAEALTVNGIPSEVVEVVDNNCIDREVTKHKPTVVVIEALWVVPEKFDVLKKLHPQVKWFVHLHSNIPFLAYEGIAMKWLPEYAVRNVGVITNSDEAYKALRVVLTENQVFQLNNVYSAKMPEKRTVALDTDLRIGCFGAVRPMKNQLVQALAAIQFARMVGRPLKFFINGTRSETGGDPVLKNLRELFKSQPGFAELVEIPWLPHDEFLSFLCSMDICLQVSLSETFNIVTADAVNAGIPVVTSQEIDWVSRFCQAPADLVDGIAEKMWTVYRNNFLVWYNRLLLSHYSKDSIKQWVKFVATR